MVTTPTRGFRAPADAARRLAIRPYPAELEKDIEIRDGRRLRIRPIRPEDAPALVEMGRRSTPEDLRLRWVAFDEALAMIDDGRITDLLTIAALERVGRLRR